MQQGGSLIVGRYCQPQPVEGEVSAWGDPTQGARNTCIDEGEVACATESQVSESTLSATAIHPTATLLPTTEGKPARRLTLPVAASASLTGWPQGCQSAEVDDAVGWALDGFEE